MSIIVCKESRSNFQSAVNRTNINMVARFVEKALDETTKTCSLGLLLFVGESYM